MNMDDIKAYYQKEVNKTVTDITHTTHDFLLSVLADSHLDHSLTDTVHNIAAVDRSVKFDCVVHLGDFMTGNITRSYTKALLAIQMQSFQKALANGVFYPAQGNHDGFLDNAGGSYTDIALDEDWYEATAFVDTYPNVSRPSQKPYFFVDYPDKKLRLIILNSQYYEGYNDGTRYKKHMGIDPQQFVWLSQEALQLAPGWTVMLFSHDAPFAASAYSDDSQWCNGSAVLDILSEAVQQRGIIVAGWLIGHHHGELITKVNDIPFILIGSQTSYVPQLWQVADGGFYYDRQQSTVTEDLWDAVALDMRSRKLTLFRFGAGGDRSVFY